MAMETYSDELAPSSGSIINKKSASSISKRGSSVLDGGDSPYYLGWKEFQRNPYDPVFNPGGCIQLGLAESKLSLDLLEQWLDSHPEATRFPVDEIAVYPDYAGLASFRKVFASFMEEVLGGGQVAFDPDNIVMTAGATAAIDVLSFCLAQAGDVFLVPAPYYPGFTRDSRWRSDVELIPVESSSANGFNVTPASLKAAFHQCAKLGKKVRALLVASPSNPVGNSLRADTLKQMLEFIKSEGIHLICDEVYAGSTFDDPEFVSIAKVMESGDYDKASVHIVYGISKDLGLPGLRVGALYSWNKQVLSTAARLGRFCSVSTQTQCFVSAFLSDKEFVRDYLRENKKRLKARRDWVVEMLRNTGTGCAKGNAGFYCWIDLSRFLKAPTEEAETELWKNVVYEVGLNLTPGSACHSPEPGWFRFCFANQDEDTLAVAIRRLEDLRA
ncbi:1-aminocyclopropane-1-carboxylate synthase [Selaginella moellendorffii]|uniref:1-aminocyclopropane-1-carboxylate synthase n=1 Tax=Selaginella moellendorffii TaxID=88036 RepID=D8R782_SELML|nr:1-aminocyclopropane-1-carboxylate synthase 3 [Selaginella moellendorffii]EFJ31841.1 1-aminocyclopropane-1-carboxylate synthase [Selaginella moellendorffii]|eukprot:XP_024528071.1 1-aminocyclopropane-1-carboxylate synthase 3 [Selaginella moellendorffii]